jgi:hypothetical protein
LLQEHNASTTTASSSTEYPIFVCESKAGKPATLTACLRRFLGARVQIAFRSGDEGMAVNRSVYCTHAGSAVRGEFLGPGHPGGRRMK